MRSAIGFAVGFGLVVALLPGCGPGKKLPDKHAGASEKTPADSGPAAPAASDPEATAVVSRALDAHSGGKRDRLERLKTHAMHLKGNMFSAEGELEAVVSMQAAWPGQLFSEWTTTHRGARKTQTYWFAGERAATRDPEGRLRPLNPAEREAAIPELMAEVWLAQLVPFLDPATKVFSPTHGTIGDKPVVGVRVSIPDYPVYTAVFDKQTGYLVQIDYAAPELGRKINKTVELKDLKPQGELVLPTTLAIKRDGVLSAAWSVVGPRDFPDRIDPAVFQMPKQ